MRALDTNALVRFLVRDDEHQAQIVRTLLLESGNRGEALFITSPVVLETIWVLSSAYRFTRMEIVNAFENLMMLPAVIIEQRELLISLCRTAGNSDIDLSDLYIGLTAQNFDCATTLTFDRKAASSPLFTLLK